MWRRHLIILLIVLIFVLLQTSFGASELWQSKINLMLALLIGLALFYSLDYCLIWLVIGSFLLDLFSGLNFGLISLSLLITIVTIYLIADNYITHDSLMSVLFLVFSGTIFYNLFLLLVSYILWKLNFAFLYYSFDFLSLLWQISLNIIVVVIAYLFRNILKRYLIIYDK